MPGEGHRGRGGRGREATDDQSFDDLERYLRTGPVLRSWVGIPGPGGGHPNKRRVELAGGVYVVAKLGEDDNGLRMARSEAAAWKVVRLLGWHDLMAATVLRDLDLEGRPVPASLQVIWPSFEWLAFLDKFEAEVLVRAAVFDVVIRMSDRGGNNWLGVGPPGEGQALKLIDHGHAFTGQGGVGSSFVDRVQVGTVLAEHLVMALERLTEAALRADLLGLVPDPVVVDLAQRADALVQARAVILP
jgi:hypothetical protein